VIFMAAPISVVKKAPQRAAVELVGSAKG